MGEDCIFAGINNLFARVDYYLTVNMSRFIKGIVEGTLNKTFDFCGIYVALIPKEL